MRFMRPIWVLGSLTVTGSAAAQAPVDGTDEEEDVEIVVTSGSAPATAVPAPAAASPGVTDLPPPTTTPAVEGPAPVAEAVGVTSTAVDRSAELDAMRVQAELEALRARLDALEAPSAKKPLGSVAIGADAPEDDPAEGTLRISGFLQPQIERHQLSEDELTPDGTPYNQDRFLVRRGRLRVDRAFTYGHAALEIDANTVRGPFLSLRRAETSFILPARAEGAASPLVVTAGLSEIPFGHELRQGVRRRVFLERTTGSLAFFRGEPDVGLRASGALGPWRYAVAVLNGVPLDDRPNANPTVYQRQKTAVGRIGFERHPTESLQLSGGLSYLSGTGFHAGTPERKASLGWRDLNQDGLVTVNELNANPAQAATPSQTFERWAVNADLQIGFRTPLGATQVYGEFTLASNLDRGLYVADPVATGFDLREVAWYAAIVQEVGEYGLFGARVDQYDGNADLFAARRGVFIPEDATITTVSPVVGAQLRGRARAVFQYDYVVDQLGRDTRGEPIDLRNDTMILRVQLEF